MLAVARAFAVAYMPYQVGRLPGWARAAIKRTCSREFANYLLSRPAEQSPLLQRAPERRRDISGRERQPRHRHQPGVGQLRLCAGSVGHRRVPADPHPAERPLVCRRAGDVSGGAKAVAVRARAHDPAPAAGGDARAERHQRIRRHSAEEPWRVAGRSVGSRRPTFRSSRAPPRSSPSGIAARRSSPRSTTSSRHSAPPRLPGVHSGTNGAGAAGPMQIGIGGTAGDTWDTIKVNAPGDPPGQPPNVYDEADAVYSAAHYLQASGAPGDWPGAIFTYNHSSAYVQQVLSLAAGYYAQGLTAQGSAVSLTTTSAGAVTTGSPFAVRPARGDPAGPITLAQAQPTIVAATRLHRPHWRVGRRPDRRDRQLRRALPRHPRLARSPSRTPRCSAGSPTSRRCRSPIRTTAAASSSTSATSAPASHSPARWTATTTGST